MPPGTAASGTRSASPRTWPASCTRCGRWTRPADPRRASTPSSAAATPRTTTTRHAGPWSPSTAGCDGARAAGVWDEALAATWHGPAVWFHGDVAEGNLLVRDGQLSAVIDFGTSGVGDPACDLVLAWTFLSGAGRRAFRDAVGQDDAAWARARGWALWKALITEDLPLVAVLLED